MLLLNSEIQCVDWLLSVGCGREESIALGFEVSDELFWSSEML